MGAVHYDGASFQLPCSILNTVYASAETIDAQVTELALNQIGALFLASTSSSRINSETRWKTHFNMQTVAMRSQYNENFNISHIIESLLVHTKVQGSVMAAFMRYDFSKAACAEIQRMHEDQQSSTFSVKKKVCALMVAGKEFKLIQEQIIQRTNHNGESTFFKLCVDIKSDFENIIEKSDAIYIHAAYTKEHESINGAVQEHSYNDRVSFPTLLKNPPNQAEAEFYALKEKLETWNQKDMYIKYKILDCFNTETDTLNLDHQHLIFKGVPQVIGYLTHLRELDLSRNSLSSLPPEIGGLTALNKLALEDNLFGDVPPCVITLPSLTCLNLTHNLLPEIPPTISKLTSLRFLYLAENELTSLPTELHKLSSSLTELLLESNQFSSFPLVITQLTSLQRLGLSQNSVQDIPPTIKNLSFLNWLALANTKIESLPSEMNLLSKLQVLNLKHNRLESDTLLSFSNFQSLTELDLEDNRLTQCPSDLDILSSLVTLNLKDNRLSFYPFRIYSTSLTELNLANNAFVFFPEEVLSLRSLTKLDLSSNKIEQFPEQVLNLSSGLHISMGGNPFTSPFINILLFELAKSDYKGPKFSLMPQTFSYKRLQK